MTDTAPTISLVASAAALACAAGAAADWIPATVLPAVPQVQGCMGAAIAAWQDSPGSQSANQAIPGTIWVGAPLASGNARQSGIVEAWTFNATSLQWMYRGQMGSASARAGAMFGASMAHSGSLLVVGSPCWRGPGSQGDLLGELAGLVEVFGGVSGIQVPTGTSVTRLNPLPLAQPGDMFGTSVAAAPASDGSGTRIFASAPLANAGTVWDAGRVHCFRYLTDTGWTNVTTFSMPGQLAADRLGSEIAADGDRLFASIDRNGGMVATFTAPGNVAQFDGLIAAPAAAGGPVGGFGRAMDVDSGFLVVGAPGAYGQPADEGVAFVLDAAPPHAVRSVIASPFPGECAGFGASVSLRRGTLVVGTESGGDAALDGKVAIYDLAADGSALLRATHAGEAGTGFGSVVATSGAHVAMGAPTAGSALSGKVRTESQRVPPRSPDLNGDGRVSGSDLGILIGMYGMMVPNSPADLNYDNSVDGADLALLLGAWGTAG
jgi:hypothetical protein